MDEVTEDFTIITKPQQVKPYLRVIQDFADSAKEALGFLTRGALEEQSARGRLWVAWQHEATCAGYLLFGGQFPRLKVFQLFVAPQMRGRGVGSRLVEHLVEHGERNGFLGISARVAVDLPANTFWERAGFALIRQIPGGASSKRILNVRFKQLRTPALFKDNPKGIEEGIERLEIVPQTLLSSPTYVADLNVLFDVLRNRTPHEEASSYVFRAALNHDIRLYVTPEFMEELSRNTSPGKRDPVLEFADMLPVLRKIDTARLQGVISNLRDVIFPKGTLWSVHAEQRESDLLHIAYCVHHRAKGFITRDKAILLASKEIQEEYGLEVLSPTDLREALELVDAEPREVYALGTEQSVSVKCDSQVDHKEIEDFLLSIGVEPTVMSAFWLTEGISPRHRRTVARVEGKIVGVASWNPPSLDARVDLSLYVDENVHGSEIVIDHVLETVLRDSNPFTARMIVLQIAPEQLNTRATALKRGFRDDDCDSASKSRRLTKFAFNGVVGPHNWSDMASKFSQLTGLQLPHKMPKIEEFQNTGVIIVDRNEAPKGRLRLFDFETMVSPALVLCPGRSGLILPIQKQYAEDLLARIGPQGSLLPVSEAYLRIEKAYFRAPGKAGLFRRGLPLLFYVSGTGGGSKEVIGCARVIYSDVLDKDAIEVSLVRQGVLSSGMIGQHSDKHGRVHVFTFDNFNLFTKFIPFRTLREKQIVSGANLVSPEALTPTKLSLACKVGFDTE